MGARATGASAEVPGKPKQLRNTAVAAAVVVVIIVVAAIAGSSLLGNKGQTSSSSSTPGSSSQAAGLTQVISLSNSSAPFTLKNSTILIYPLTEPIGRLNPRVQGNFTVLSVGAVATVQVTSTSPGTGAQTFQSVTTVQTGGAVEVRVMNATSYTAFLDAFHPVTSVNHPANATNPGGENVSSFYDSMPQTSGSFNVSLPAVPGTYYMVFANRSYENSLVVTAQVNLIWELPSSG